MTRRSQWRKIVRQQSGDDFIDFWDAFTASTWGLAVFVLACISVVVAVWAL